MRKYVNYILLFIVVTEKYLLRYSKLYLHLQSQKCKHNLQN